MLFLPSAEKKVWECLLMLIWSWECSSHLKQKKEKDKETKTHCFPTSVCWLAGNGGLQSFLINMQSSQPLKVTDASCKKINNNKKNTQDFIWLQQTKHGLSTFKINLVKINGHIDLAWLDPDTLDSACQLIQSLCQTQLTRCQINLLLKL